MVFSAPIIRQSVFRPTSLLTACPKSTPRLVIRSSITAGSPRAYSAGEAHQESYPAFNERYAQFFDGVQDLFELQRGLNNCFAYDLVPAVPTIEAALKAARRVNDLPTAIRIFEGLQQKVENKNQYKAYLDELKGLRDELGVPTKEELYGQSI